METKIAQHTPTPWYSEGRRIYGTPNLQSDTEIVQAYEIHAHDGEANANAAFIVRACNNFEIMLGLLKGTLDYYEIQGLTGPAQLIKEAIARAEGRV